MTWAHSPPPLGSGPSAPRPRDLAFAPSRPAPSRHPRAVSMGQWGQRDAAPERVRADRQIDGSSVGARAHLPPLPLSTHPQAAGGARLHPAHGIPAAPRHRRRSGPVHSPCERSHRPPCPPSAPPPEVPGFGAVWIARTAGVRNLPRLVADPRLGVGAGHRWREQPFAAEACLRPSDLVSIIDRGVRLVGPQLPRRDSPIPPPVLPTSHAAPQATAPDPGGVNVEPADMGGRVAGERESLRRASLGPERHLRVQTMFAFGELGSSSNARPLSWQPSGEIVSRVA